MTKNIAILPGPILKRTSCPIHICFWRCKYPGKRPNIHWSYPWLGLPILSARVFKTEIGDLRNCASATTPLRWGQGVYFLAFFWFNGSLLLPHSCHESLHSIIQIQQKNLSTSLRLSKKRFPRSNLCQDIKWVCFRQAQVNLWETGSFSCISHLQSFSKAVYVMFIHISQDGKGLVNNQLLAQN